MKLETALRRTSRKLPGPARGQRLTKSFIELSVARFNEKVGSEKYWRQRIELVPGWEEFWENSIPKDNRTGRPMPSGGRIHILLDGAISHTINWKMLRDGECSFGSVFRAASDEARIAGRADRRLKNTLAWSCINDNAVLFFAKPCAKHGF